MLPSKTFTFFSCQRIVLATRHRPLLPTSFPINVDATERWEGNGCIESAVPEDGFAS